MNLLFWAVPQYSVTGTTPEKFGAEFENIFPYGVFEASDQYFYLGVFTAAHWERFCDALALDDLRDDARFATNADRLAHRDELRPLLARLFEQHTFAELRDTLAPRGVMIERIRTVGDAVEDEHARARQSVRPLPGYPDVLVAAAPMKLERGLRDAWTDPPDLGSNTHEYLEG